MLDIHHIPIWTNRRRIRFLARFRAELRAYFDEVSHQAFPYRLVETERAGELRASLEERNERCRQVVRAAGIRSLTRVAPGERTGEVVRVDLLRVVFELARYNLAVDEVLSVLEGAEARYRAARGRTWLRTFNPLYWIDMLLGVVEIGALLPVRLVGREPREVARSPAGITLRYLVRVGALVLLAWVAVRLLDGEGRVLAWGRELAGRWF